MAKFFKYKTQDELSEAADQLGSQLPLSADFSVLFRPAQLGSLTVGNRLCIQPMEGCDGTLEGAPDELTFRRYQRFGAGGAKLIWGEATAIDGNARMNPRQLWLSDRTASAIEDMLAQCRKAHTEAFGTEQGLALGLQLTHSGRFSFRKPLLATHDPLLDPLTIDKSSGRTIDPSYPLLTDDDLKRIEDQYVLAARHALAIGCDFVDIKQCHRYLLSELLAATNRPGPYGGTLENRTRLFRNVVGRIRAEVPSLVIVTRMNVYDGIPYVRADRMSPAVAADTCALDSPRIGLPVPHELPLQTAFGVQADNHRELNLTEPLELAHCLREWGVSALNVSMGNPYANPHVVRPAEFAPVDGYEAPEHPLVGVLRHFQATSAVQMAVPELPVVGSGYSWLQDFSMHAAAANVRDGRCTFAGIGRGALSHPDFARHLQEHGTINRKLTCRTFSYCTNLMRNKNHPLGQYPTGCPPFDNEIYGPLWKEIGQKQDPDR